MWVVLAAFVVRGAFYSSVLPLWEGFDEWKHFAVVEEMARTGKLLVDPATPIPTDVQDSIEIAPVPWDQRNLPFSITDDSFWRLSEQDRAWRISRLRALSPSGPNDRKDALLAAEGLQPPLYYWLTALLYRIAGHRSLVEMVLLLRFASILIVSAFIPFAYLAARRIMDLRAAVMVVALAALMPELLIDVARVGNECLGITVATLLLLCLCKERSAFATGLTLGCGLLTKAYFLTAIPGVFLLLRTWRSRAITLGVAALASFWWFLLNRIRTGTWTGLTESVMLKDSGSANLALQAGRVNWRGALDSILISHIWFGGWSGLQVRSWIYHSFMAIALAACIGLAIRWRRGQTKELAAPAMLYAWFWIGQLYNVMLLFASKGASTSMGWYLYAVVAAEVILLVQGLRTLLPGAIPGVAICLLALDLFTMHFIAIPYYSGFLVHRADGSLPNMHVGQLADSWFIALGRLGATKPAWLSGTTMTWLWLFYLAASFCLAALPFLPKRLFRD